MWPEDVIVEMEDSHDDERGSIQPLYDLPTKSVVLITSREGDCARQSLSPDRLALLLRHRG